MRLIKKSISVIHLLVLLMGYQAFSQDAQFTQPSSSMIYNNPAFVGTTNEARVGFVHRAQWSSIPGAFTTQNLTFDYNLPTNKDGFGIQLMNDKSGGALLKTISMNAMYAHEISLGSDLHWRSGIGIGLGQKQLDIQQLVFEENTGAEQPKVNNSVSYLDVSVGSVLHATKYWMGVSAIHVTKPAISFIEGNDAHLPLRLVLMGGGKLLLKEAYSSAQQSVYIYPSLNFKMQGTATQLDVNCSTQFSTMVLGLGYRNLPLTGTKNDAVTALVGIKVEGLSFMYSYDYTVSKLKSQSGGGHEVSLVFEFGVLKKWTAEKRTYSWL